MQGRYQISLISPFLILTWFCIFDCSLWTYSLLIKSSSFLPRYIWVIRTIQLDHYFCLLVRWLIVHWSTANAQLANIWCFRISMYEHVFNKLHSTLNFRMNDFWCLIRKYWRKTCLWWHLVVSQFICWVRTQMSYLVKICLWNFR